MGDFYVSDTIILYIVLISSPNHKISYIFFMQPFVQDSKNIMLPPFSPQEFEVLNKSIAIR